MARSQDYLDGFRAASKRAVAFLHEEAADMNDRSARNLLNLAADRVGFELKRAARAMSGANPDGGT